MPIDYSNYKTPIFPNINDNPVAPIASKAGNGADLISRVNGLIDELQTTLNSLPSANATLSWTLTTPNHLDNEKIEVYYLNVSEHSLYTNAQVGFQPGDLIHSYSTGVDFNPGSDINISSLIADNSIGYYFFLFKLTDNSFKNDSWINQLSSFPKGTARSFDQDLQVVIYDADYNTRFIQRVKPIVVNQPIGTVSFSLMDEELVIG